eukprot:CAMPEP_0185203488 /NCGR_PEP_ID=MMETSP1140-20130426/53095_1 /TAXON_ID=298111 /ORGANISM="Pavlova sp., Strain CCMP459" /LENGTH=56 /DNA_ID=CAMNT_0027770987 /DNA_START=147 /DNA_END=313 /DNA_ORIENTATION=+
MNEPARDARRRMTPAMSSVRPMRPRAVESPIASAPTASMVCFIILDGNGPGLTALT